MLMSMSTYRNILYKYVTTVLGVFIIIFNGVKIYVIYRRKNHQSLGIIYITNLAFSDFMVGVTMVILKSMDPFMRTALADNEPAKEIYRFLRFFCIRLALFTSIFSLTAITINQLWGVIKPLSHRKLTKKTAYKTCVLIWVVSVLLVTPLYLLTQFIEGDFNTNVNLIFPVGTILGMLIFFISYSLILRKLKQNKSALIGRQNIVLGNKNQNIGNNDVQKYTSKVITLLVKFCVKTVVIFCICWLPYSTCSLMKVSSRRCSPDVTSTWFVLAYCSSLINPFLYFNYLRSRRTARVDTKRKATHETSKTNKTFEEE